MKFRFTFLLTFISFAAQARCLQYEERLDLREKKKEIFEQLDIRDQGHYGYCYAHTAAFLVDFMRLKRRTEKTSLLLTSAVWTAIQGTLEEKDFNEEGGFVCPAVKAVSNDEVTCVGNVLKEAKYYELGLSFYRIIIPGFLAHFKPQNSKSYADVPHLLLNKEDLNRSTTLTGPKKIAFDRFMSSYELTLALLQSRGFSKDSIPTKTSFFDFIYSHYENDSRNVDEISGSFMKELAKKECKSNWNVVDPIICEDYASQDQSRMVDEVDRQLEKGYPVGISYCSTVLGNKKYLGQESFSSKATTWSAKKDCGPHASVIIGRIGDSYGKCNYLIRNSWGKTGSYAWPTDKNDILVEESALNKNLLQIHSIR